jgi:hypothetical protein
LCVGQAQVCLPSCHLRAHSSVDGCLARARPCRDYREAVQSFKEEEELCVWVCGCVCGGVCVVGGGGGKGALTPPVPTMANTQYRSKPQSSRSLHRRGEPDARAARLPNTSTMGSPDSPGTRAPSHKNKVFNSRVSNTTTRRRGGGVHCTRLHNYNLNTCST